MYHNNHDDNSDQSTVDLTEALLRRYLSLGATLSEAVRYINRNFQGETIITKSCGKLIDENDLEYGGVFDSGILLDYLFQDPLDDNPDSGYY